MRSRIAVFVLILSSVLSFSGCVGIAGSSSTSKSQDSGAGGSATAPVITNVSATSVTNQGATISWISDVASTSQVDYGTTTNYGQTTGLDSAQVTSHSKSITGLSPSTLYHYRVRSQASNGMEAVSADFSFTTASNSTDQTPPTVSISSPAANASLSGSVSVKALASDNVGVVGVQFLLDGSNLGTEVTASPYAITWDTKSSSNGTHLLSAVARDAAGNKSTSAAISVTVSNTSTSGPDTTPPTVTIASPTSGTSVSYSVTVTANATDNVGVAGVQFLLDGNNLGPEVTTNPFSTVWNTLSVANGPHSLTAIARDAAGNKTTSAAVTVTVSNSTSAGSTAADADYQARCSDPNVIRCVNLDTALPANTGQPNANGQFADVQDPNYGGATVDSSTKIGSLAGSTLFTQPGDSPSSGGKALLNFMPDTSFQVYPGSPSGDEFYIQWRQRVDQNYIDFHDGDDMESNKQYILTFGDVYKNSSTWANTKSCSTGELVQINANLLGIPSLYYSCADKDGQYQNLFPVRSGDYLYQNAIGCLRSKAKIGSPVNITTAVRKAGVVTVTTASALNVNVGDLIEIGGTPIPDASSTQNTFFNGIHTVAAVVDATHIQFAQAGADQSVSGGTVAKVDQSHCWRYKPYEWMTFQLHVKAGRSYQNDHNYHRDSTVELWAAHEGQPSQLISSVTDYDLMFWDNADSLGNARPTTSPITNWWTNQGVTPGYGRMDFMQYESNRCASTAQITAVERTAGVSKIYFYWANGAGSPCVTSNSKVVITGTPSGSFDGIWTSTSSNNGYFTFTQSGPDVAKTSVTGAVAQQPRWMINCNGAPCDIHTWISQFIISRRRVADPADYTTTPVPDPPDNLVITAVDPNSGAVTMQWRDNAANETGFKIEACANNDRYQCQYLQAFSDPWTQVGTAAAVTGRYGTQTYTFTPSSNTALYSFRVKATNSAGDSTWSNTAQNTPLPPSDVVAQLTTGGVQISWTRNTPAIETGFAVYRCAGTALTGNCTNSTSADSYWTQVCSVGAGITSCVDNTVAASTTYVYRVKSFNNAGSTQSWGGDGSTWREFAGNTTAAQVTTSTSGGGGAGALAISTQSVPNGTVNQSYTASITASGGYTPYSWSLASGNLPAGLTLNSSTGAITGIPTSAGTFSFTVKVTDASGQSATKSLSLTIAANLPSLAIITGSLPSGTVNQTYSATVTATGGTAPYSWSITAGSLPTGLTLNSSTGVISGTPTSSVSSSFTVKVSDAASLSATAPLSIVISQSGTGGGGLPTGIGWHSLGDPNYSAGPFLDTALIYSPPDGQGSTNQCPKNNFNGDPFRFSDLCKNVINAQSSGIADTRRNIFYLWGGGHGDYAGNEIYAIDLNVSPVTLRRVKDPTTPTAVADPNYKYQSSCISGLPADTSSPSYMVQSLTRDASGKTTVVFTTSTVFVPWVSGNYGKSYVQLSGFTDATLNENARKIIAVSTTSLANDTIVYQSATATATTVTNQGTAIAAWSSCVPDSNGLGCAPNSIHSTGNLAFIPNPTDPTKDMFFKASGSLACGPGNQVADTWTLPLDGGVSNSSQWINRNRLRGFSIQNATNAPDGFPNVTEYDSTSGLTYVMDHNRNTLYAYDLWGTKGPANTWYGITPSGFSNSQWLSGVLWHSSSDTQRIFFAGGGCAALPISSISRSGGIATATVPYLLRVVTGSRIVVYDVNDSSFDGGDGTNVYSTVSSISGTTLTFPTSSTTTASSSGGEIVTCDGTNAVHGGNGVLAADVTGGTSSTAKEDWTYATLDVHNVDLGDPSLGNTCAEFLSGGQNPLNGTGSGYFGGISLGMTIDTVTGNIVGWPNEGTSIYQIIPDTVNKRWTCKRETYPAMDPTAAPANTSSSDGPNSTWGTWHRFSYFPQVDAFFLVNAPDQPARILRIR